MSDKLKRYGVIGDPISHSKSPQIFNRLFEEYEINAYYARILAPDGNLIKRLQLDGFNITSPYKSNFLTYLPKELEFESPIRIVNAVRIIDEKANCNNYDITAIKGFIYKNLHAIKTCLVIGTGDTANTAAFVAKDLRIKCTITGRNKRKAQDIATKFSHKFMDINKINEKYDLIISTIPLVHSRSIIKYLEPKYLITADYTTDIDYENEHFTGIDWLIEQAKPFFHKITGKEIRYKDLNHFTENEKLKSIIHFTGYMGSGKSTIGKLVAEKLNRKFIDIDELIVKLTKMDIAEIFEKKGEAYFRKIEADIFQKSMEQKNVVIASGGGAVIDKQSYKLAKENAFNIYLSSNIRTMFDRCLEYFRPLHHNDFEKFDKIFEDRKDIYFKLSDMVVSSDDSPEVVAGKIVDDYNKTN